MNAFFVFKLFVCTLFLFVAKRTSLFMKFSLNFVQKQHVHKFFAFDNYCVLLLAFYTVLFQYVCKFDRSASLRHGTLKLNIVIICKYIFISQFTFVNMLEESIQVFRGNMSMYLS